MVEATYQKIRETDEYTSGNALRFPNVVRFRPDKKVEEIDNVGKLHELYELLYKRIRFRVCSSVSRLIFFL